MEELDSKGEKEEISQRQNSIILLSGPIPGIIIGFSLLILGFVYSQNDLTLAGLIFLFLNLFNLIPFSPFDGGRLVETIFFNQKEFLQIFFLAISSIGIVIIAIFLESYFLLVFPLLFFFWVPTSALFYLYSSSDSKQDQVVRQCMIFNIKEADLNPEIYREYCYCISDFITRYVDKKATSDVLIKEIDLFLNPDFHPNCNSELKRKLSY